MVNTGRTISTGTGITGGGNLSDNRTFNLENIASGSTSTGALFYNGTTRSGGRLYGGTTDPASTTRLNYDGNLHVNNLVTVGNLTVPNTQASNFWIRNTAPTIYLRDTDHNVSMIHCNSNIFYVLRGATDATTWTQVNGVWPLEINLTNNNATFGGTVTASSDVRFKKNIKTIDNGLSKVLNLRGVSFEKIDTEGTHIGVIAQEVEKIIPEVVYENDDGKKSVAYGNIIAVLIEAIKEQQLQIDILTEHINKLIK
jgi:hypothetical protein